MNGMREIALDLEHSFMERPTHAANLSAVSTGAMRAPEA
jgi:hypothetical protein